MPLQMPIEAIAVPRIVADAETRVVPATSSRLQHAASFTTLCQLPGAGRRLFDVVGGLCGTLPGFALQLGRQRGTAPAAVASLLQAQAARARHRPAGTVGVDSPSRPLLSVVIPVWNGERFLRSAVENVLSQQYAPIEILIVNDGSTDGTEAEVSRLPCDVRYFAQHNGGPAAARNRGIRESSGDVIAFLDVDDLWPENILALLVSELMGDAAVDVVHGYGQVLSLDPASGAFVSAGSPEEAFPHYIGAGVYRRRVFDRIGLFDSTMMYGEDTDWFARAKSAGAVLKRLDLVTMLVRRHDQNMTRDTSQLTRGNLRAFKRALDRKRAAT
jgi:GT2 family glycosyltransferase